MILLPNRKSAKRSAFTLVELLVVLAIIALLSALLFPAFKSAQENSKQTTCQSNLHQIYLATQQYYQDERAYPDSLLDLMGEGSRYNYNGTATDCVIGTQCNPAAPTPAPAGPAIPVGQSVNDKGGGYFRGGNDTILCPDDDTANTIPRSSYGSLTKIALADLPATTSTNSATATSANPTDAGLYAWNYWGYRSDGFAFTTPQKAKDATTDGSLYLVTPMAGTPTATNQPYNQENVTGYDSTKPENLIKNSLSYRFAPPSTIITHCTYHRLATGTDIIAPGELYDRTTRPGSNPSNARDMILRLDGTVKAVEVSTWDTTENWRKQTLQ